jgi:hypothetical protein
VQPDVTTWLAWAAGFVALPLGLYGWYERQGREAWPSPADETPAFEGYRHVRRPRPGAPKAPALVRLAALSCFAFGQMFLPGLALGLVGLFFGGGVGVLALPGLYVAHGELGLGRALLLRSPDVVARARSVVNASWALNGVAIPVCVFGLSSPVVEKLAAVTLAYVIASMMQAALLFRVARNLELAR